MQSYTTPPASMHRSYGAAYGYPSAFGGAAETDEAVLIEADDFSRSLPVREGYGNEIFQSDPMASTTQSTMQASAWPPAHLTRSLDGIRPGATGEQLWQLARDLKVDQALNRRLASGDLPRSDLLLMLDAVHIVPQGAWIRADEEFTLDLVGLLCLWQQAMTTGIDSVDVLHSLRDAITRATAQHIEPGATAADGRQRDWLAGMPPDGATARQCQQLQDACTEIAALSGTNRYQNARELAIGILVHVHRPSMAPSRDRCTQMLQMPGKALLVALYAAPENNHIVDALLPPRASSWPDLPPWAARQLALHQIAPAIEWFQAKKVPTPRLGFTSWREEVGHWQRRLQHVRHALPDDMARTMETALEELATRADAPPAPPRPQEQQPAERTSGFRKLQSAFATLLGKRPPQP